MKKRIVAIIVAMATVFSMTGCESEEIRAQVEARAKEAQQQDVEEEEEKEQEEEKEVARGHTIKSNKSARVLRQIILK